MGNFWPKSTRERPLNIKAVTPLNAEKEKEACNKHDKEKQGKPDNDKLQDVLPGIDILKEKVNNVKGIVTKMRTLPQDSYSSMAYDKSQLEELSRLSNPIFSDSSQIREDANRLKAQNTKNEGVGAESAHNRVGFTQSERVSLFLTHTFNDFQKLQAEHKYETTTLYQCELKLESILLKLCGILEMFERAYWLKINDRIIKAQQKMEAGNVQLKRQQRVRRD